MSVRSKVLRLPLELREELDRRLAQGAFTDYTGLARWLNEQGYELSRFSVWRYGRSFEHRLKAFELASAQTRAVAEVTSGDETRMTGALIGLVQQKLFVALVEAEQLEFRNFPPLVRAIGELCRTAIAQKQHNDKARARLDEQKQAVMARMDKMAPGGGLSPAAHRQMRAMLLGIDPFAAGEKAREGRGETERERAAADDAAVESGPGEQV